MTRTNWAAALFVTAEALGWYIALRAAGALVERDVLVPLEEDLLRASRIGLVPDDLALNRALEVVGDALDASFGGPSLLVVLLTAGGAYLFGWWLTHTQMGPPVRAFLAIAISLPLLQVLIHAGITGDPWVWQGGGIENITGSGDASVTVAQFIANPDLTGITGNSATITVVGLFALWIRFLLAGRTEISFDRALRSFTFGFLAAIVGGFLAITAGADRVAALALPQFALAAASIALAHAARADARAAERSGGAEAGTAGGAPWALSLGGTLAALIGIALLFSLVALLDLQRVFETPVSLLGDAIEGVLLLIARPIFWVVNGVLTFVVDFLEGDNPTPPSAPAAEGDGGADDGALEGQRQVPGWVVRGGQAGIVVAVLWFTYRAALRMLDRTTRRTAETYVEARSAVTEGTGTGSLLRRLLRRKPSTATLDGRWVRAHGAYGLFARTVAAARKRGFEPRAGETPLAFAEAAATAFDEEFFAPVGEEFDAARYGRRGEDSRRIDALGQALHRWEQATPPSDELRARVRRRRAAPPAASRASDAGAAAGMSAGALSAHQQPPHQQAPNTQDQKDSDQEGPSASF